jgi:hypothetical protein
MRRAQATTTATMRRKKRMPKGTSTTEKAGIYADS